MPLRCNFLLNLLKLLVAVGSKIFTNVCRIVYVQYVFVFVKALL